MYDCGKRLDDKGFHFITCKFGGGPVWSHDRIVDGWRELFRELGLHYKREERDRYVNNQMYRNQNRSADNIIFFTLS